MIIIINNNSNNIIYDLYAKEKSCALGSLPLTMASCCIPCVRAYSNSGLSGLSNGSTRRSQWRICSSHVNMSTYMCRKELK